MNPNLTLVFSREELIDRMERALTRMQNNGPETPVYKSSLLIMRETVLMLERVTECEADAVRVVVEECLLL